MHSQSRPNADLQNLLSQLGRYCSANEIPSALSQQDKILDVSPTTNRLGESNDNRSCLRSPVPPVESRRNLDSIEGNNDGVTTVQQSRDPISFDDNALSTPIPGHPQDTTVSQMFETLDCLNTSDIDPPLQTLMWEQGALSGLPAPVLNTPTSGPSNTVALSLAPNEDTLDRTRLAACTEITFSSNLRRVLQNCKTDRDLFLRKVEESKASLPNGRGWKAAIATKQENADMRDLLSIYHSLGICGIVKDLGLSELGRHVAQRMKDMTTKQDVDTGGPEEAVEFSWTSPALLSPVGTPVEPHPDQDSTPRGQLTTCEDVAMLDDAAICSAFMASADPSSDYGLSSTTYLDPFMETQLSPFSLVIEDWHQHSDEADLQVVI
ncbi:hypothetical protein ACLX1H_003136 [Fusarium chlamydosporum]